MHKALDKYGDWSAALDINEEVSVGLLFTVDFMLSPEKRLETPDPEQRYARLATAPVARARVTAGQIRHAAADAGRSAISTHAYIRPAGWQHGHIAAVAPTGTMATEAAAIVYVVVNENRDYDAKPSQLIGTYTTLAAAVRAAKRVTAPDTSTWVPCVYEVDVDSDEVLDEFGGDTDYDTAWPLVYAIGARTTAQLEADAASAAHAARLAAQRAAEHAAYLARHKAEQERKRDALLSGAWTTRLPLDSNASRGA